MTPADGYSVWLQIGEFARMPSGHVAFVEIGSNLWLWNARSPARFARRRRAQNARIEREKRASAKGRGR